MFQEFIQQYGYYAVFLFACIEGEIAVLTAGFLCQHGLMSLKLVILFAFLGTFITEQCLFFVGRIYGTRILQKYPKIEQKSVKIIAFLRKYDAAFIFGSRFIYGIRNFSPIVIGIAGINPIKFSSFNIPAAFIWSVVIAGAGYLFSDAIEVAKSNVQIIEIIALTVLIVWFVAFLFKRQQRRKNKLM
ncbi:MAG: DedA family protein [Alphaproteobacteria bacterium]|nr:DedA family protein [Alphaproteobacteria bacterium]